jgi:hypothetical protein
MRSGVAVGRWVAALIASILMLLVGPAASALGAANVRFVHAVPGSGAAQLQATAGGKTRDVAGRVGFGEVGRYGRVPARKVTFKLSGGGAKGAAKLRNGAHYTVLAAGRDLKVLPDGRARGGAARLRVVQAAPELGTVEIRLGDRRVAKLFGFEDVARYRSVDPGAYAIRVTRPDDGGTLAARGGVPLTAGTSSTAFVVGTRGEPLRVVVASDRMAAPRGAPATGLGGLADDGSSLWPALLAGLLAALAGAAGYLVLTGRSRGRGA